MYWKNGCYVHLEMHMLVVVYHGFLVGSLILYQDFLKRCIGKGTYFRPKTCMEYTK